MCDKIEIVAKIKFSFKIFLHPVGFFISEGLCDKHGETARLERDGWTILKNKVRGHI